MKRIRMILRDFSSLMKAQPGVLLVIVTGLAVALMTHFIAMGVILELVKEKADYAIYNTLSCTAVERITDVHAARLTTDKRVENAFIFFESPEDHTLVVGWHGHTPEYWFPIGEGRFPDETEDSRSAYVSSAITTYDPQKSQTISLQGKTFTVTGSTGVSSINLTNGLSDPSLDALSSYSSIVFIPFSEAADMSFSHACVRVQLKSGKNGAHDMQQMAGLFFSESLLDKVIYPSDPMTDAFVSNMVYFLAIGMLCLIAFMNILAMYWYALSMQKRKYTIYAMVGASKKQLWKLLIWQYTALFMVACVLSLCFTYMTKPLFQLIEIHYSLNFWGFVLVFGFEYGITLLLSLPKMKRLLSHHNWHGLRRSNGT